MGEASTYKSAKERTAVTSQMSGLPIAYFPWARGDVITAFVVWSGQFMGLLSEWKACIAKGKSNKSFNACVVPGRSATQTDESVCSICEELSLLYYYLYTRLR